MKDIEIVQKQIATELAAGLITKGDAATQRAALNQILDGHTDNKVQEVLLRDAVRQKTTNDLSTVDALTKKVTLDTTIAQFELLIITGQEQIKTDDTQLKSIGAAMNIAKQSPYYLASVSSKSLWFAFVPYTNAGGVKLGAPIYDCYLSIAVCHYVGAVKAVFHDEERAMNPISGTELRGSLIRLDLVRPEAAKSKTLFIGGKPLLF